MDVLVARLVAVFADYFMGPSVAAASSASATHLQVSIVVALTFSAVVYALLHMLKPHIVRAIVFLNQWLIDNSFNFLITLASIGVFAAVAFQLAALEQPIVQYTNSVVAWGRALLENLTQRIPPQ